MLNFWSAKPIAAHQAAETFFTSLKQLVEVMGRSAIPADEHDHAELRADMARMEARMSLENPSETLVAVGSVERAIEEYNARVGRSVRQYQTELRGMVGMLTETVSECTSASERSKQRLQGIEHRLDKASAIEDIRLLKLQLAECLESLRAESEEQRKAWAGQMEALSSGLHSARAALTSAAEPHPPGAGSAATPKPLDPLTGLPRRSKAMEALAEALAEPANQYAVVFAVERVESANARYGFGIGDQMLQAWQQLLHSWFGDGARIFRWGGPAFLMLIERDSPAHQVRTEIAQRCANRHEKMFNIGNRAVLLLIAAAHMVIPLAECVSADLTAQRIDTFVHERAG
ncbi:MAG: diguanylate cyclase [Acidobacteria bacterium]|nr:diguanylate cyclase [Acidobacteriota bacterium]